MTPVAILAAHRDATVTRVQGHVVILAVQDTTSFNVTLHRKFTGLGLLGQAEVSGFFLYTRLAVSTDSVPRDASVSALQ